MLGAGTFGWRGWGGCGGRMLLLVGATVGLSLHFFSWWVYILKPYPGLGVQWLGEITTLLLRRYRIQTCASFVAYYIPIPEH